MLEDLPLRKTIGHEYGVDAYSNLGDWSSLTKSQFGEHLIRVQSSGKTQRESTSTLSILQTPEDPQHHKFGNSVYVGCDIAAWARMLDIRLLKRRTS